MRKASGAARQATRRQFLGRSAAAAGVLTAPLFLPGSLRGAAGVPPSARTTVGLIGLGAMGRGHLRRLVDDRAFQVVGVCDVDAVRREAGRQAVEAAYGAARASGQYSGCAAYNDYRDLLARADLDAVVIVTPDHWHALQAVDAARTGKDVYCEKPVSLTLREGRRVVETVQRYGRIFQTGTQYRSIPTIRRICQFVRAGGLGKVRSVYTLLDPLNGWIRSERFRPYAQVVDADRCGGSYVPLDFDLPAEPVPEGLDWDLWVGPAPWKPYNRLYHTNPSPGVVPWSFSEAFGLAAITWHLSHSADVIQYALGAETSGPAEIIHPSTGAYPTLTCRYASGALLHFVDHWGMVRDPYHAVPDSAKLSGNFGGVFVGERGWVTALSAGGPVEGGPESLLQEIGLETRQMHIGANNHHANWLDCIRTGVKPSADEEIGHRAASLGQLAMIAYRLGRSLRWDPVREEFPGDETANRLRARAMRAPWRM